MAAMKAPKAELTAAPGPDRASPAPMTTASPTAARRARRGSSGVRSTVMPDRAVSFSARSQLMGPSVSVLPRCAAFAPVGTECGCGVRDGYAATGGGAPRLPRQRFAPAAHVRGVRGRRAVLPAREIGRPAQPGRRGLREHLLRPRGDGDVAGH